MDVLTVTMTEARGGHPHAPRDTSSIVGGGEESGSKVFRPASIDRHIGWRLYQRRIGMGYSQADLARAVGVSFQQIHKYERAHSRVSASGLWVMANALDVEIDYFYKGLNSANSAEIS